MHSILKINSLLLPVHIGQSKEERQRAQEILFHIHIGFLDSLKAEQTDNIADAVCYDLICKTLQKLTSQNTFALIEKLAQDSLKEVKSIVPRNARVSVCVHKKYPPLSNLKKGVSYTCGDLEAF